MSITDEIVKYETDNGDKLSITIDTVRELLAVGNVQKLTRSEIVNFMRLCQARRLNPFTREAYLIKWGDNAQIVVGKDYYARAARRSKDYRGFKAGIIVKAGEKVSRREGSMVLPGEYLVGGWCQVFIAPFVNADNTYIPVTAEVSMTEYTTGKSNWKTKPATMIRKVAYVQAHREAFPDIFSGLYAAEEMNEDPANLPDAAVEYKTDNVETSKTPANGIEKPVEASKATETTKAPEIDITAESEVLTDSEDQPIAAAPPASAPIADDVEARLLNDEPMFDEDDETAKLQKELGERMRVAASMGIKAAGIKKYAKAHFGRELTELVAYELDEMVQFVNERIADMETLKQDDYADYTPSGYTSEDVEI